MSDEMKVQAKGLNKKFLFIAIALIVVGLVAALVLLLPMSAKGRKVEEQLNLGAKYLSELDYEQAIVAYEAVIKIDPKCEEAYLALVDIYIVMGEVDKAEEILRKAEVAIGIDLEVIKNKKLEVNDAKQKEEGAELPELTEEPVATATPTPSPTAVPTPTNMPTPSPTSTPTPIMPAQLRELEWLQNDTYFVVGQGRVAITKKNELYGATDIEGNVIVENKYETYILAPNKDGQFVLGNGNEAMCFDAEGDLIFTLEKPKCIYINEGYISYIRYDYTAPEYIEFGNEVTKLGVYDIKNKKLLDIEQPTVNVASVSPVIDGKLYVTWAWLDATMIVAIDIKTLKQTEFQRDWWCTAQTPSNGYCATLSNGFGYYCAGLIATNGSVEYRVDTAELVGLYDIPYNEYYYYAVDGYEYQGVTYFNCGKQIVVRITSDLPDLEYCFLIDFDKAQVEERKIHNEFAIPVVTNLADVIVAKYEYIKLSTSGNYLVGDSGDWFYIDSSGERVADYEDCSSFVEGYALVVENDQAYVIDTEFNKLSSGYPADSVYGNGNILCFIHAGDERYLYVEQ